MDNPLLDEIVDATDASLSRRVLERVASAKSVFSAANDDKVRPNKASPSLGKHLGIIRRMKEMERASEIYTHLSTQGLNRMVRDGYLPNGIEYHGNAKIQDEATLIGRGTKSKVTKKRTPGKVSSQCIWWQV